MDSIGYQWLAKTFEVTPVHPFAVESAIGRTRSTFATGNLHDSLRHETYLESYRPNPGLAAHLTFALKYEGVHLEFLYRLFRLPQVKEALEQWIASEPSGAYARRSGFFYEWLMAETLATPNVSQGNYVDALDPEWFIVGKGINNARWRVRDNLPGTREYCPLVRRVALVKDAENYDIADKLARLENDFGIDLIQRSTVWLTIKESRASFLIEREQNQEDRIRRFAAVMEQECGKHEQPFDINTLANLQRGILGESALRYGLRSSPVYVGHTVRYQAVVDYIAPHWDDTRAMLAGLNTFLQRTQGGPAIVRSAVASFGFVYIHPMADGNGRISRFLINDVLRRDGMVPSPIILPVSACITNSAKNRAAYDSVLERFSRPLMQRYADQYHFGESVLAADGVEYNLHFDAWDDARPAWRYPDLTAHVAYLAAVIDETITLEMRTEARFLQSNENARGAIKEFLEAPDHDLDAIIRSMRQNGNVISNQIKKRYPIFSEKPFLVEAIQTAVSKAFEE